MLEQICIWRPLLHFPRKVFFILSYRKHMKPLPGNYYHSIRYVKFSILCQFYEWNHKCQSYLPSDVLIGIFTLQVFVTPQGCLSILKTNVLYKPLSALTQLTGATWRQGKVGTDREHCMCAVVHYTLGLRLAGRWTDTTSLLPRKLLFPYMEMILVTIHLSF